MHDVSSIETFGQSEKVENKNIAKRLKFDRALSVIATFQVKVDARSLGLWLRPQARLPAAQRTPEIGRESIRRGDDKSQGHGNKEEINRPRGVLKAASNPG